MRLTPRIVTRRLGETELNGSDEKCRVWPRAGPGDSAELLWIQNNNPDDPGPDRPGRGESGRISKWHMTDAKDDTVHGNLRGNLEMLQNIQSHGGWYSRDEIIIQVKLFKLECVWFPLRAQSQPASPFTNSWWLFMPSAGNYRSQILNSSKHKIRHSRSPAHVAPAGTVLNNSNVFTTTTQIWVCLYSFRGGMKGLRSIIATPSSFSFSNSLKI